MNEIRRVLKVAAWRLLVIDFFRVLAVTLTGAVGVLIAVRIAQQIFGLNITWERDWMRLFAGTAAGAAVAAAAWSVMQRARTVAVARALDERANLRESLSTALCVAKSEDPWAKVVVETARQKAVSVKVNQAIPITAPRLWPVPFAAMLTLAILWWSLPRFDVLGLFKEREQARVQEQEKIQAVSDTKDAMDKVQEALKNAKVEFKDEQTDAETGENKPQTPDEIRRAAIKKLTAMTDKLNEMKAGEKAQQLEAMKQAMKQLKQPGPGPLENLTKSLQQGNFAKAQQDLEELSKKMASSETSPEDKAKAAEQMKKLAEQLQKLSEKTAELEKKLEQAGMGKEAAKAAARDPQAMQKALEQLNSLSAEQKQELMKMAKAQAEACKQCSGMGEKMGKMSKDMGKNGMGQEGQQASESLSGQLSEMEMMASDCQGLDAAMEEAMRSLCKLGDQCNGMGDGELQFKESASPWKAGETNKKGGGRGGPGQSGGSNAGEEQDAGVNVSKTMSPAKQGQGPIVGTRLVQGDQVKGESVLEFQAAVEAGDKAATEAIVSQDIPRELHDSVKGYFGRLEKRVKVSSGEPKPQPK